MVDDTGGSWMEGIILRGRVDRTNEAIVVCCDAMKKWEVRSIDEFDRLIVNARDVRTHFELWANHVERTI